MLFIHIVGFMHRALFELRENCFSSKLKLFFFIREEIVSQQRDCETPELLSVS